MAVKFYATVIGARQGTFKSEGTQGGLGKGKIPGVDFAYGVETPQFYQAAFTNEVLTSVTSNS